MKRKMTLLGLAAILTAGLAVSAEALPSVETKARHDVSLVANPRCILTNEQIGLGIVPLNIRRH